MLDWPADLKLGDDTAGHIRWELYDWKGQGYSMALYDVITLFV